MNTPFSKFVRTIHPETKTLDAKKGIVEYVASDETLDRDGEILKASGWRFTNFAKNSPFIDNHNYDSIGSVLGMVVDARVQGSQLIETVQWAVDPDIGNIAAQIGFKMTDAGFLKAVSIGGLPIKIAINDGSPQFRELVKGFGLPSTANVKRIFLEQEQLELSACPLGSNPNAVAKAYEDGIIPDSFIDTHPALAAILQKSPRRSFSFAPQTPTPKDDMPHSIVDSMPFSSMFQILGRKSPKPSFDHIERERGSRSPAALDRAVVETGMAMDAERQALFGDAIEKVLSNPDKRTYLNAIFRHLMGRPIPQAQLDMLKTLSDQARGRANWHQPLKPLDPRRDIWQGVSKGLDATSGGVGAQFFLWQAMAQDLFMLTLIYGAYRTLGLRTMASTFTKFAEITTLPTSVFVPPSTQAATPIAPDGAFTGVSLLPECNYVSCLLPVSIQLYEDSAVDFARVLLEALSQSVAAAIDYGAFQGNGNIDATNGGQTGMFMDATIPSVGATANSVSVALLDRQSFVNTISAVTPAALQRECEWWINPAFLPALLTVPERERYMLRTPGDTGDGTWRILGFKVNWTAQAPSVNTPGSKVAAFGNPDSFLVALREDFQLDASPSPGWNTLQRYIRATSRSWSETRDKNGLATLALAKA